MWGIGGWCMQAFRLSPSVALLSILLAGCEGSTVMTHTVHNRTDDTLSLIARFDSVPFQDSVRMVLPPDRQHTVFTYDMRGKCTQCWGLASPMLWVDTLELETRTWLVYPVESDWITEVNEGRTWIQYDHMLNVGIGMVD